MIYWINQGISEFIRGGVASCMMARDYKFAKDLVQEETPKKKFVLRRLTPLECCRLQGFPDWWEDGAEGSESARYKMWGNGIALPCAVDVLFRIAEAVRHEGSIQVPGV